jgi:hypothetical protein
MPSSWVSTPETPASVDSPVVVTAASLTVVSALATQMSAPFNVGPLTSSNHGSA